MIFYDYLKGLSFDLTSLSVKYVAEHKSGEGGHQLYEKALQTDVRTTLGPPPPDKISNTYFGECLLCRYYLMPCGRIKHAGLHLRGSGGGLAAV